MNFLKKLFLSNKKFSLDTIWLFVSQILMIIIGFLVVIIITKHLGFENFGIYNQIVSFYAILSIFFALGLNNSMIKKISNLSTADFELEKLILTNNLGVTFIQSVLFCSVFYGIILLMPNFFFSDKILIPLIGYILLALPFFNLNKNIAAYFTGKRNQRQFSLNRMVRWLVLFIVVVVAALVFKSISLCIFAFFISEFVLFFYNVFVIRNSLVFRIDKSIIFETYRFGIQSYVSEIVSVLNANVDVLILGYLLSSYDLGVYSFILLIARTLLIFPGILSQNVNPITAKLWDQQKIEELVMKYTKVFKLNSIVVLIQFLFLSLLYYFIIIFYKTDLKQTFHLFLIMACGMFIYALISWAGGTFIMIGQNKINNIRTMSVLFLTSSILFFLGFNFGLLGSSIAVLINSIAQFAMIFGLLIKMMRSKTSQI